MTVWSRTLVTACIAFGLPLSHGLVLSFSGSVWKLLLTPLTVAMIGYGIAGIASVGIGVAQAWKGRWSEVLPCLFIPAALAMFVLVPGTYTDILETADYIHFATFSARYTRAVDAAPRTTEPRYLWFFWNELPGGLGPDTHVSLVFDESDEFALLDWERTDAWKLRAERAFKKGTGYAEAPSMPENAHHLFGHWYVFRMEY